MKMTNGNLFSSSPYRFDTGAPNLHSKDSRTGQIISKEENARFVKAKDTHPPADTSTPKRTKK